MGFRSAIFVVVVSLVLWGCQQKPAASDSGAAVKSLDQTGETSFAAQFSLTLAPEAGGTQSARIEISTVTAIAPLLLPIAQVDAESNNFIILQLGPGGLKSLAGGKVPTDTWLSFIADGLSGLIYAAYDEAELQKWLLTAPYEIAFSHYGRLKVPTKSGEPIQFDDQGIAQNFPELYKSFFTKFIPSRGLKVTSAKVLEQPQEEEEPSQESQALGLIQKLEPTEFYQMINDITRQNTASAISSYDLPSAESLTESPIACNLYLNQKIGDCTFCAFTHTVAIAEGATSNDPKVVAKQMLTTYRSLVFSEYSFIHQAMNEFAERTGRIEAVIEDRPPVGTARGRNILGTLASELGKVNKQLYATNVSDLATIVREGIQGSPVNAAGERELKQAIFISLDLQGTNGHSVSAFSAKEDPKTGDVTLSVLDSNGRVAQLTIDDAGNVKGHDYPANWYRPLKVKAAAFALDPADPVVPQPLRNRFAQAVPVSADPFVPGKTIIFENLRHLLNAGMFNYEALVVLSTPNKNNVERLLTEREAEQVAELHKEGMFDWWQTKKWRVKDVSISDILEIAKTPKEIRDGNRAYLNMVSDHEKASFIDWMTIEPARAMLAADLMKCCAPTRSLLRFGGYDSAHIEGLYKMVRYLYEGEVHNLRDYIQTETDHKALIEHLKTGGKVTQLSALEFMDKHVAPKMRARSGSNSSGSTSTSSHSNGSKGPVTPLRSGRN